MIEYIEYLLDGHIGSIDVLLRATIRIRRSENRGVVSCKSVSALYKLNRYVRIFIDFTLVTQDAPRSSGHCSLGSGVPMSEQLHAL